MAYIEFISNEPLSPRLVNVRSTGKDILTYGMDNLYPQKMIELKNTSPITKSAVSLIAQFNRGDGFENGDIEVNDKGETANDLLRYISEDLALFNGFALLVNSSALGLPVSLEYLPFEYVRLGLPTQRNTISYVEVSNNWEGWNADRMPSMQERRKRYNLYNPKTAGVDALQNRAQVFYYTPRPYEYPLSSIDAIMETALSDHELQNFELGNIVNGFLSMSVFKYPTAGDLDEEEENIKEKLQKFKGARNANSIFVVGIDEDYEGGDLVEQVPANNNDTLFTNTTLNIKNRILQNFALPSGLMGMLPEGAVFTATQLADEYTYMNLRTKDTRNLIERKMQALGLELGRIIPNQFESSQMLDNNGTDNSRSSVRNGEPTEDNPRVQPEPREQQNQ